MIKQRLFGVALALATAALAAQAPKPTTPAAKPKSAPKTAGAPPPKTAASRTTATAPKTNPPKMPGQKLATGQPADAVGDICLLPDIAGFAH